MTALAISFMATRGILTMLHCNTHPRTPGIDMAHAHMCLTSLRYSSLLLLLTRVCLVNRHFMQLRMFVYVVCAKRKPENNNSEWGQASMLPFRLQTSFLSDCHHPKSYVSPGLNESAHLSTNISCTMSNIQKSETPSRNITSARKQLIHRGVFVTRGRRSQRIAPVCGTGTELVFYWVIKVFVMTRRAQ